MLQANEWTALSWLSFACNRKRLFGLCPGFLLADLEDDLKLNRHPERKARNSDNEPNRCFLDTEDISEQVRDCVCDPGLIEEVTGGCHKYSEPDYASHTIKRSQVLFRRSESAQSRRVDGISSC